MQMFQSRGSVYPIPMDSSTQALFPFGYQEQAGLLPSADFSAALHRNPNMQLPPPPLNGGYTEAGSQVIYSTNDTCLIFFKINPFQGRANLLSTYHI